MKTFPSEPLSASRIHRQRGSSVLIILVLMACMAMLIAANTSTLHALKQELKLIEKQQQKKFATGTGR